jgi:hypothetical protein
MKKKLYLFFALLVTNLITMAQERPEVKLSPKMRSEKLVERLQVQLLLTDQQKTSLFLILLDRNVKLDSLKIMNSSKVIIKEMLQTSEKNVIAILTPAQNQKYANWKIALRNKNHN